MDRFLSGSFAPFFITISKLRLGSALSILMTPEEEAYEEALRAYPRSGGNSGGRVKFQLLWIAPTAARVGATSL